MKDENIYITFKVAKAGSSYVYQETKRGHVAGDVIKSMGGHAWLNVREGYLSESHGFGSRNGEPRGIGEMIHTDDFAYRETAFEVTLKISHAQLVSLRDFFDSPLRYGFEGGQYDLLSNSCVDYIYAALKVLGYNPNNFQGNLFPSNNPDNIQKLLYVHGAEIIQNSLNRHGDYYQAKDIASCIWLKDNGNPNNLVYDDLNRWTSKPKSEWSITDILNTDYLAKKLHDLGQLTSDFFNGVSSWVSARITDVLGLFGFDNSPSANPNDRNGLNHTPIGAFYDSRSVATDSAAAITDKTPTLFDQNQKGITANQLSALDSNADGQLSGNELTTLSAWSDRNENGQVDADEMKSLAQRGIARIRSSEFVFFTQGNSRTAPAGVEPAAYYGDRTAPFSDFRRLRDTDPLFITRDGFIEWGPPVVKINYENQNYMVGTDGDDAFNANFYAAYTQYFNTNLLTHFLGGGGNDRVGGSVRNDQIWGGTGNDVLLGYAGDDGLYGEDGDDQMSGDEGNDYLLGGAGNDRLYGGLGGDHLDGGSGDDTLIGNDGNDTLLGNVGNDELQGNNGNDLLLGEAGNDRLFGQLGNDQLWGGDGDDVLVGFTGRNDDKQSLVAGESDDDLIHAGNGNDYALGGVGNDTIHGEAGNDDLEGGAGDDLLYGGTGADRLFGQVGNDVLYGGDGDDILVGFTATNETKQTLAPGETDNDWLYGGAGNDTLLGGLGNDYLDGGAGADAMEGGLGDDTYVVNSVNDSILERKGEGYDRVISSTNYLLNSNIEELRLVEGLDIHGTGNALDNVLIGNSRDNILDGVTGADRMVGGAGNDTFYVDNSGDQTVELTNEGTDTVQSSISHTLADNVENLILLDFSQAERGMIDGQASLVYGYPKANELDYMQGDAEPLFRGTCALTAIANMLTQADRPTSEGDVLKVAVTNNWTVQDPALSPNQRGGSNFAQQQALLNQYGIRNDLINGYNEAGTANLIRSGRGVMQAVNGGKLWDDPAYNDNGAVNHMVTLTGAVYGETSGELLGFYIADSGRQKVSDMTRFVGIERFRQAANVAGSYAIYTLEPLKLWNEDINATGNAQDNVLIGNRGDNVLSGGAGNDVLEGQAGNDVLDGGAGNDTLNGGSGSNTYMFGRGYGRDRIAQENAYLEMQYINLRDAMRGDTLSFARSANDLNVGIVGTNDSLTVNDWFSDPSKQNFVFETYPGEALHAAQVNRLIELMAADAPKSSASSSLPPGYLAALVPVLAPSGS